MRKLNIFFACVLLTFGAQNLCAQDTSGSRDLYNTYNKSEGTAVPTATNSGPRVGRPGARLRIELKRNGRVTMVSPKTVFMAGDKVRFHFAMNFPGYVVIINEGSSGSRSMLFPYEGVGNHIGQTADYTVPQGDAWFEFDNTAGEEQLTFIMSRREIHEVVQLLPTSVTPAATANTGHPSPTTAPSPKPTPTPSSNNNPTPQSAAAAGPKSEEQEILAALNSRSLQLGRDLNVVVEKNEGYVLASETALEKPLGFKLVLKHR